MHFVIPRHLHHQMLGSLDPALQGHFLSCTGADRSFVNFSIITRMAIDVASVDFTLVLIGATAILETIPSGLQNAHQKQTQTKPHALKQDYTV